jgi:predicted metal-dependent hydrolase
VRRVCAALGACLYNHRVTDWCDEPPPSQLLEGIEQFNRGEFFEQHETLELLWRAERRDVRFLYQGILQIGVAFYHIQRRNHHGAVYMLTRGQNYLRPFAPSCQRVDVEGLLADAGRALALVEALGPGRLAEFDWRLVPRVTLR